MKKAFSKGLIIFKYLFIVFSIIYWIGIIIDDWVFIEKYWRTNWLQYIGIWTTWFLVYSLGLSLYYWGITAIIILINYKIIKPIKKKANWLKQWL
jgi:hypothetical protein